MNILVTGGAGFLGSHIVDALIECGHNVTILDLAQSQYAQAGTRQIICDIKDRNAVGKAIEGIDIVYHYSGIAGIEDCKKNPRQALEINLLGTLNVLEACVASNVKRIIFASSAYVFSKYGYIYRTSKLACENLIRDFNQIYGLQYTNVRYGSLYGRRADKRNSIHRLLNEAYRKGRILYKGTGSELREYIHVKDASRISAKILSPAYINKDIIVTGNEKFRYDDILEMIKEIMDYNIIIEKIPATDNCHYLTTPYSFNAGLGMKVTDSEFIDFGQGILDCLEEIAQEHHGA